MACVGIFGRRIKGGVRQRMSGVPLIGAGNHAGQTPMSSFHNCG